MDAAADGDCFVMAYRVAVELELGSTYAGDVYVVHGVVMHPETGRHWHAWCEVDEPVEVPWRDEPVIIETAIDRSNGLDVELPAVLYRKDGRVSDSEVFRYTLLEAQEHMLRTSHYGPWAHDHERLCPR